MLDMIDTTAETTEALPEELAKAIAKFDKRQAFIEGDHGGATEGALAIAEGCLPRLTEAFISELKKPLPNNPKLKDDRELLSKLKELKNPAVLALATLQTTLHGVTRDIVFRETCKMVGVALAGELWAAGLTKKDRSSIERKVRAKHSSVRHRQQAARGLAKGMLVRSKTDGKPVLDQDCMEQRKYRTQRWAPQELLKAGSWCVNLLLATLPDLFVVERGVDHEATITITEGAYKVADDAIAQVVTRKPVWLPTAEAPRPWTGMHTGGTWDARLQPSLSLVRTRHKETEAAVRQAVHDGTMKPAVDALNTLQAVPWQINRRVLGVIQGLRERAIDVPGLPRMAPMPMPEVPEDFESLTDAERQLWRFRAGQIKAANRGMVSDRALFAEDMITAEAMAEHDQFYTAMNLDWRGRVYGVPSFNFQREDRVRALFLFADGEPLGVDGLYWLKVHVANCFDYKPDANTPGISKQPFEERVKWVDSNLEQITQCAIAPMTTWDWWSKADSPFLLLAAAFELVSALDVGTSFVSRLPVSFDGSCSGLQHLCAMTRAAEGSLVNLTPSKTPQDVYQVVADRVSACVLSESSTALDADVALLANQCLAYGIDRKLVKRNVMTYSYSSKKFGMAEQHREDTMRPLRFAVIAGKYKEHPFGKDEGYAASKYLANHVYDAIESVVTLPAQAMGFLQTLAKTLAHEGKPLSWTTPCGLPWVNRYHHASCERVKLWMHDRGVRVRYDAKIATGKSREIDKDKAANGVAPNFVHALDASHLLMVANAAHGEGIRGLATVHDSFGCLASRAGRFREIILDQFVTLYTDHDVLAEVRDAALRDLTHDTCGRIPETPQRGPLDIEEVRNAQFAFA